MRRRPFHDEPGGAHNLPPVLLTFNPGDWTETADLPLIHDDELRDATAFSGTRTAMLEVRIAAFPHPADRHLDRAAIRWRESRRLWAKVHGWPGDEVDRLVDEQEQLDAWVRAHGRPS